MRRVRCPGCSAIILASGERVQCDQCGLSGKVDAPVRQAKRDPLQITIDLRKLYPGNWGAGGRALVLLVLLAGTFVAGGFAGMTFERTRSEVLGDLGGDVLSGGSDRVTQGSADDPMEPAGQATLPEQTKETIRHEYSGTGRDTYPVELEGGLVRLVIDYKEGGSPGLFKIEFRYTGPEERESDRTTLIASDLGTYNAVRYLRMDAGAYDVSIGPSATDEGTWSVRVEEPRNERSRGQLVKASHTGDWGIGPYTMDGTTRLHMVGSESGRGPVAVRAFLADGTQVSGCRVTGYTEPSDRVDEQFTCNVDGLVYFDIVHPRDPELKTWTLSQV